MKSYLLIVFFSFLSTVIFSQEYMKVENVTRETSNGIQPGFLITVKEANFKTVQKEWEKNIKNSKITDVLKKSELKVQFAHKGDEYIADNAIIPSISSRPISVIANITDIKEGIRIIAFFILDSVYISKGNSKEETYLAAQNYMRNFGIKALKQAISSNIDDQEDYLKELENRLIKLRSKKDDYEKGIGKNESNIREMKSSIKTNLIDQDRQMEIVNLAKDTLYTFDKKSDEYKIFKGKLKTEQKEISKLEKNNKSYHAKIKKYELSIEKYKENISLNLKEQKLQKSIIDKQKLNIKAIEKKLQSVK